MKLPFDRSEWDFEELTHRNSRANRKRLDHNTRNFIEWLINLLKSTAPRELREGEKYHCQGVRMNPENNMYLKITFTRWIGSITLLWTMTA